MLGPVQSIRVQREYLEPNQVELAVKHVTALLQICLSAWLMSLNNANAMGAVFQGQLS